jgi:hypothetical protein
MASSFDPSLRYCWRIIEIGGWRGRPVTDKQFAIADLSPHEEMMVVEASYPLRGAETPRRPACRR